MEKELIESYFSKQIELCNLFGFKNDGDYHIVDCTRDTWLLIEDVVRYADNVQEILFDEYFEENLNTNTENIYRIKDYTAVLVTTDSNEIWLMIFDNKREITKNAE